jgi:hypothetical protein
MTTGDRRHEPELQPSHERSLGRTPADGRESSFVPLQTLSEARAHGDAVVVLTGDDSREVYVVCPVSEVRCDEGTLGDLLLDLDEIAWPGNPPGMRRICFQRVSRDSGAAGGWVWGRVKEGLFVHPAFERAGLAAAVYSILRGERARIR